MKDTLKEFWLKWRLRVAKARVMANTNARKILIEKHQRQVAKCEAIEKELKELLK